MADPAAQAMTMRNNIEEKTGKSFSQWQALINTAKLEKHGQIVKFLKMEHSVTHGFANLIASDYLNGDAVTVDLVAVQYSKGKENLQPIYQALINELAKFAKDMEIAPKKTYVSLRHKKQFALIQPSTKTRIDVGINLKNTAASERLELSKSFNSMVSHRVRVTSIKDIDTELINWLQQAYQEAA